MKYQQHTTTGVNIMFSKETIGDIFNQASDEAMSLGYAFGSDCWIGHMNIYLDAVL